MMKYIDFQRNPKLAQLRINNNTNESLEQIIEDFNNLDLDLTDLNAKKHEHINKELLDNITVLNNVLYFMGNPIGIGFGGIDGGVITDTYTNNYHIIDAGAITDTYISTNYPISGGSIL